ncbi:hypothetical protein [Phormidesmis priestleyi]|nr:hypothetical protein [Phormidesmis priestleyi]
MAKNLCLKRSSVVSTYKPLMAANDQPRSAQATRQGMSVGRNWHI